MSPADFRSAFPAFTDATDPEINAAITLATNPDDPYVDDSWGGRYAEGLWLFVAHTIVIQRADKAVVEGNDVVSRVTEHLNISRHPDMVAKQAEDPFMRTVFGQRFRYLSRRVGPRMVAV